MEEPLSVLAQNNYTNRCGALSYMAKGEKDFKNEDAKGRIAHGVGGHRLTGRGPRAARDVGHEGGYSSALRKRRLDDRVGGRY